MAAKSVPLAGMSGGPVSQRILPSRASGPQSGPDLPPSRSTVTRPARGLASSSTDVPDAADRSRRPGSGSHSSSGDGSPAPQAAPGAAGGSRGASGAGADSSGSSPADQARPAQAGDAGGDSRSAQRAARTTGGSCAASSQTTAQDAAGNDGNDFAAALAQTLAATPTTDAAGAKAAAETSTDASGSDQPSGHCAKHSDSDPVSTALTLLEHALAGVLLGIPAAASAVPAASADPGGVPPPTGQSAPAAGDIATLLATQLAQDLPTDAKAASAAPGPAAGSATTTTSSTSTSAAAAAAAALAAAQMTAGPPVGLQQTSNPASMMLSSPVGSSAWTDELGAKVTWMAHQGIESASLQLSPAHLGPLQVSISVHNGQASVWFGAAQPDTRTALQQSLPQLRQLFANQGLTLTDTGVSRESPRGRRQPSAVRSVTAASAAAAVTTEGTTVRVTTVGGRGLVDTYA